MKGGGVAMSLLSAHTSRSVKAIPVVAHKLLHTGYRIPTAT